MSQNNHHRPESSPLDRRLRVCMVMDRPLAQTETFLQAQLEQLPAQVTFVCGFLASIEDRPVMSFSLSRRALDKAIRLTTGRQYQDEATRSYLQAFTQTNADVVLAQYGPNGVHVLDACRAAQLPLVVHFHGHDASNQELLAEQSPGYQRLFAEAQALVVVSQDMRRRLLALGAPKEKLRLNPYGVDVKKFGGANPAEAPPVFLSVGRFTEKKAPHLTMLAFAEVWKTCPDARLRMIGDGKLLDACRQLATALGIVNAVEFLGSQPPEIIQQEMKAARCFAQHSVVAPSGDAEGTPVAVIEAGASGLPVVATRHAGIPDVVVEGETGFLVAEHDVAAMASAMRKIATEPGLAGKLGTAARARVAREFNMEKSIQGLHAILLSCCNSFRDVATMNL